MKSIDISNAFLNCIIPLFGFILFVCIYDNSVFFAAVDNADSFRIVVELFASLNIALIALVPVCMGYVRQGVENGHYKNKKRTRGLMSKFIHSSNFTMLLWCVILFLSDIIWLVFRNISLFIFIVSFEIAILIYWLIWFYAVMDNRWPEIYSRNILKEKK